MIYRVLGVVSLAVGAVFGLVTLLVLLPFIDNFNTSLLVLCGVFGILAYVFLAIGWQLFHPPAGKARRWSRQVASAEEESGVPAPAVQPGSSATAGFPATEAAPAPATSSAAEGAEDRAGDEDVRGAPSESHLSPNGGDADSTYSTPGHFKKPGAPVPHK
ncbi:MAG: hypothetical protein ACYC33_12710 [Thermoleophilia bacterium]